MLSVIVLSQRQAPAGAPESGSPVPFDAPIAAVDAFGTAALRLSDDGRTMWGQSRDMATGIVMNMQMQR